jgi:conjugal transfer pilus assembly protein TrbC
MTRPITLLAACLASAALFAAAAAQTVSPDLDLEAIRARSLEQVSDAEALAAGARERAKALVEDAKSSAAGGHANGAVYAAAAKAAARPGNTDTFDFDTMVAGAGDSARAGFGEAPRFIAFASTAMPAAALRQMIDDVTHAGGVVVFRGLPQGSAKAFVAALSKVADEGKSMDGVGIDPRLFRAFAVDAVPTYVVAASDFDLCSGFDCASSVPPHDRMSGNVTARYALETFADGGGPGARIAAQHLARLDEVQP